MALFGDVEFVKNLDSNSVELILIDLLSNLELDRNLFTKRVSSWATNVEISIMLSLVSEHSVVSDIQRNAQEEVGHFWNIGVDWKINIFKRLGSDSGEIASENAPWLIWPVSVVSHFDSGQSRFASVTNDSFSWSRDKLTSVDSPWFVLVGSITPVLTTPITAMASPVLSTISRIHSETSTSICSSAVLEERLHMLLEAFHLVLEVLVS